MCLNVEYKGDASALRSKLKVIFRKKEMSTDFIDYISNKDMANGILQNCLLLIFRYTEIIKAINAKSKEISYKAPKDVYEDISILHEYFENNDKIWFLSNEYDKKWLEHFKKLGINQFPKVIKKNHDSNNNVIIINEHGQHKRGKNKYDPDIEVEGLSKAISSPTFEKSEFIWNNIAIPNSRCVQGEIEESTNKHYNNSTKSSHISEFGRLLMNSEWLPGNNTWCKPSDLSLEDLPDQFKRDERLAELLEMKTPEFEKALELVTGKHSGGTPQM
ncbi:MAG: hypothetical protein U5L00_04430 [Desulfovermiculus sp.]|nr:hypothetical protein [Desulfovermiculus sp.]